MTDTPSPDSPKPKETLKIDFSYSLVTLGSSTLWALIGGWLLYFYIPPDDTPLVPEALYGAAILAIRAVNAGITPYVGYLSDRAHGRWGRRLPFMFVSGLPLLVLFVFLWMPPIQRESIWNLAYLVGVMGFYNIAYVFNQVPYTALLPEIATTDRHRVRLSAWMSGTFLIGMILGGVAGPLIDAVGYAQTMLIYAIALLPSFYLPFLVLRENPNHQVPAAERLGVRQSIALMMHNKPFLIMTAAGIFSWGIAALVQSAIPYIVTEICLLDESDTWFFYIPAIAASLLCYPAITWLSNRWGKWAVLAGSMASSAVVMLGLVAIGDWLPVPLHVQGIAWIVLQAITASAVVMLPPAFGAEIVDHDEKLTGQRREGTYYAAWGLLNQVIAGIVSALLPLLLLLGRSRYDPNGPLGVRMVGILGAILLLVGFLVFLRYPFKGRPAEVQT
jgi:GPH family glycoside/pentoside/hexuronide:cation symporter